MNIYFVVEGKTERDVYPAWLSYLVPELKQVEYFDDITNNNYYLFSSDGIPYIENDIINAARDVNSIGKYDYFVVCIDADAATISQRKVKIIDLLEKEKISLNKAVLKIIVQNHCIETWFLGNRKVYTRNPQKNIKFIEYSRYYNVSENDPEFMQKPKNYNGSISRFNVAYLKAMFNERGNMSYSKSGSKEVQKLSYLNEIRNRATDGLAHIRSFADFFDFCMKIKVELTGLEPVTS
jgi:hypothetical protein